jgi:hypothetical protein
MNLNTYEFKKNSQYMLKTTFEQAKEALHKKIPPTEISYLSKKEVYDIGFPFLTSLCQAVTGHTGRTYPHRDNPKQLAEFQKSRSRILFNVGRGYDPTLIDQKISSEIQTILQEGITLDLGCGGHGNEHTLADYCGSDGYIGVDLKLAYEAEQASREIKGTIP